MITRIGDAGAIALAAALKIPCCRLEALGLSGAQLTDVAALALARALSRGKSHDGARETRIHGKYYRQRANGTASEAGGKSPCTLRRLDLSRNGVTDTGARCVFGDLFSLSPGSCLIMSHFPRAKVKHLSSFYARCYLIDEADIPN